MGIRVLAALQGMGEYGALTGNTSSAAGVIGTKIANLGVWASDHLLAVIVGAVVLVTFMWWLSNPRT